jgi:hypothetical protein
MIFPIIIWPFLEPSSEKHCRTIIEFLSLGNYPQLAAPVVVIDQHSKEWLRGEHLANIKRVEKLGWEIRWIWSVDTCQTWLDAFVHSHASCFNSITANGSKRCNQIHQEPGKCVHFLIPADFYYYCQRGEDALDQMIQEAGNMASSDLHLSIGQLSTSNSDFKELVDTYGTWQLLKLWFPEEESMVRQLTTKPRSEFLALSGQLLESELTKRWFPYTQTLVLVLRQVHSKAISKVKVYDLGRLEEDKPSDRYREFATQVERIERVLKLYWLESREELSTWEEEFLTLTCESHKIIEKNLMKVLDLLG